MARTMWELARRRSVRKVPVLARVARARHFKARLFLDLESVPLRVVERLCEFARVLLRPFFMIDQLACMRVVMAGRRELGDGLFKHDCVSQSFAGSTLLGAHIIKCIMATI